MTDELISRKKMAEDFEECNDRSHKWTPERVKGLIYRQPNVDAVPVVRCKDCKHHHDCEIHFCDALGMDCPDDKERTSD